MHPNKWHNGYALVSVEGIYVVIVRTTSEIKCMGSYEKCDSYFKEITTEVSYE